MSKEVDELLSSPAFVLPRFNTLHSLARQQINNKDSTEARDSYGRMLELYNEINSSNLPADEKQKAYGKLMYVFTSLSNDEVYEVPTGTMSIGKFLLPISLVVIVLLIVVFVRPQFSLTGMVVADGNSAPEWVGGTTKMKAMGATSLNLDVFFYDADKDKLTYTAGIAPNLETKLEGNILTVMPDPMIKGLRTISVSASDSHQTAKVFLTFDLI